MKAQWGANEVSKFAESAINIILGIAILPFFSSKFYKINPILVVMEKNLLLVSNSTLHGSGYLDHCEPQIRDVLEGRGKVLFVPYARPSGRTLDDYTGIARERFQKMGFDLSGVH